MKRLEPRARAKTSPHKIFLSSNSENESHRQSISRNLQHSFARETYKPSISCSCVCLLGDARIWDKHHDIQRSNEVSRRQRRRLRAKSRQGRCARGADERRSGGVSRSNLTAMIIKLEIYPTAQDEKDCVPEAMSYRATALSFDRAEMELTTLRKITEKDAEAEKEEAL